MEEREDIPLQSVVLKGEKIKSGKRLTASFLSLVVEKRPDPERTFFFDSLLILTRFDSAEEDEISPLLSISYSVLPVSKERIEDVASFRIPFLYLIAVQNKNSNSVKVFSFESSKEGPENIPLLKSGTLLIGMGEKWPEVGSALKIVRLFGNVEGENGPFLYRIVRIEILSLIEENQA